MEIKLLDYEGSPKTFEIGDLDTIARIFIYVISGDELARVVYKDYSICTFDSGTSRFVDFNDGCYLIYDFTKDEKENLLNDDRWISRKSSYDYWKWE